LEKGRHIIDPRTGEPAAAKIAAWSLGPDATRADALSTAFMVMTPDEIRDFCTAHPPFRALLVLESGKPEEPAERILPLGQWEPGELLA
jgi:FAD:protein FMN transferase